MRRCHVHGSEGTPICIQKAGAAARKPRVRTLPRPIFFSTSAEIIRYTSADKDGERARHPTTLKRRPITFH
ncbi:hypothetical protein TcasGA2_TC034051 [Tribolium castaneum]|uniref:Uncharacterized protein n=1 Tax=Tribolium castaneum TaxID=7070 RepID=A0A139WD00_TRICA|nr:hypothetical protein TcasGA2_TC034051 [Tribolium castaneum]